MIGAKRREHGVRTGRDDHHLQGHWSKTGIDGRDKNAIREEGNQPGVASNRTYGRKCEYEYIWYKPMSKIPSR